MRFQSVCSFVSAIALGVFVSGCTQEDDYRTPTVEEADVVDDHSHDHHASGPHGGSIIELGTHDIHAEAVLDEEGNTLDIYILGSDAESAQAIELESLTLSFKHGDETEDFELKAAPQDGETDGKSSKFSIMSEDLVTELHHHHEGAALQFMADGIAYAGTVAIDHDHDHDHAHDHGEEDGHGHDEDDHGHKDGDHDGPGETAESKGSDGPADDNATESTENSADEDSTGEEAAPEATDATADGDAEKAAE